MNKARKAIYRELRQIRRERDYQSGTLQYANRPYSFRSVKPPTRIGQKAEPVYVTTNQFMRNSM